LATTTPNTFEAPTFCVITLVTTITNIKTINTIDWMT
jgi:hypothetical protein